MELNFNRRPSLMTLFSLASLIGPKMLVLARWQKNRKVALAGQWSQSNKEILALIKLKFYHEITTQRRPVIIRNRLSNNTTAGSYPQTMPQSIVSTQSRVTRKWAHVAQPRYMYTTNDWWYESILNTYVKKSIRQSLNCTCKRSAVYNYYYYLLNTHEARNNSTIIQ